MKIKKPHNVILFKKYQPRYFDLETYMDFPQSEINKHPRWYKYEYDQYGNVKYYEDSDGYWYKREYDENGYTTYFERSDGYIIDNRR